MSDVSFMFWGYRGAQGLGIGAIGLRVYKDKDVRFRTCDL